MTTFLIPTTIVNRSASDQSISSSTWTRVSWDTVVNDDESMANLGSDATKLTIPAGYTKARFSAYVVWDNNGTGNRLVSLEKNDGGSEGGGTGIACTMNPSVNESGASLVTPWIEGLSTGDYFHLWVWAGTSLDLHGNGELGFGGFTSLMAELAA
jgi:hypothetical protein